MIGKYQQFPLNQFKYNDTTYGVELFTRKSSIVSIYSEVCVARDNSRLEDFFAHN